MGIEHSNSGCGLSAHPTGSNFMLCPYIYRIYLTSTNVDTRCSATKLLSGVLGFLAESQTLLADDGLFHSLVMLFATSTLL